MQKLTDTEPQGYRGPDKYGGDGTLGRGAGNTSDSRDPCINENLSVERMSIDNAGACYNTRQNERPKQTVPNTYKSRG